MAGVQDSAYAVESITILERVSDVKFCPSERHGEISWYVSISEAPYRAAKGTQRSKNRGRASLEENRSP